MKSTFRLSFLAAALVLAACGGDARPLKVNARTTPTETTNPTPPMPPNPAGDVVGSLDLHNGIVIDEILLGVRKIEATSGDHAKKCGPFGVRLAGAAFEADAVTWQFECLLEQGTYGLLVLVDTLPFTHVGDDLVLQELDGVHASFLVRGTIDGAEFQFQGPLALVQHGGPVTIGEDGGFATFVIDPRGWFGGVGDRLDPRDAALRDEILANVRASIRLES